MKHIIIILVGILVIFVTYIFECKYRGETVYYSVTANTLTIRPEPSTKSGVVSTLKKGNRVEYLEKYGDEWAHICNGADTGYVMRKYLNFYKTVEDKGYIELFYDSLSKRDTIMPSVYLC